MADLSDFLVNVGYVVVGALLISLGGYTSRKLKENSRRKEVASLLIGDIDGQLQVAKAVLIGIIPTVKKASDESVSKGLFNAVAGLSHFYSDETYQSLLSDLRLLPAECIKKVSEYYTLAKLVCRQLDQCVERQDKNSFTVLSPAVRSILSVGLTAILGLYEHVLGSSSDVEGFRTRLKDLQSDRGRNNGRFKRV